MALPAPILPLDEVGSDAQSGGIQIFAGTRLGGELAPGRDSRQPLQDLPSLRAAETTESPWEVREMVLAHKVRNEVEAAYRRGDLFEQRALLMEAWARYVGRAEVVRFPSVRQPA